jgi:hypothetical protein
VNYPTLLALTRSLREGFLATTGTPAPLIESGTRAQAPRGCPNRESVVPDGTERRHIVETDARGEKLPVQ